MRQVTDTVIVETPGPGLFEITGRLARWIGEQGAREGLLTLLCLHTSASLTIQENADPDVCRDLAAAFARLAPEGGPEMYRHHLEGPDDMAAHIRTVLSGVNLAIPVRAGRLVLGRWQGIFLWEHRHRPHRRRIALHLLTE